MTDTYNAPPRQTQLRYISSISDLPAVLSIEDRTNAQPWSQEDFVAHLKDRKCAGILAESDEKVVGFVVYELLKHKLHVLRIGVAPDFAERDKVATQMIGRLVSKLSARHRTRITVEINERDLAQQQFLRSCGFEAVRTLKDHFPDTGDDAYVMSLTCPALRTAQRQDHTVRVEKRRDTDEKRQR